MISEDLPDNIKEIESFHQHRVGIAGLAVLYSPAAAERRIYHVEAAAAAGDLRMPSNDSRHL